MNTPYGETRFSYGESGSRRWLEITDPLGERERVEYMQGAPGIPYSDSPVPAGIATFNAYINGRNSYYWDKHAMRVAAGDYTQARIKHFLHALDTSVTSPILESVKYPLENRIWYNYPGQSWAGGEAATWHLPSAIARVLPDGTTQITRKAYNAVGNPVQVIDPAGRETDYEYADNGIDLLRVKQKTAAGFDVLAQYTYNAQHLPVTYTDAAGQLTTLAYNAAGQLTAVTNPKQEVTRYVYDTSGYLTQIVNPLGKPQMTYTYDAAGRIASTTDSEGLRIGYAYDALDRLTTLTYPDGTTRTTAWDKLDPVAQKDREGRVTRYGYDALRRLTGATDPLWRLTRYGYDEDGRLKTLTDPLGQVTAWERDIEGRVTAKVLADGSRTQIAYDNASRIDGITDALGQTRRFHYGMDDLLTGLSYENALNATPSVSFSYDPYYPRRTAMLDGTGLTTYAYHPAGQPGAGKLSDEIGQSGPVASVHTDYDVLGRPLGRSVDSAAETYAYDALGRLTRHASPLGTFNYGYLGQTGQPTRQSLAGQSFTVDYQYETNLNDRQLKGILNRGYLSLWAGRSFFYQHSPEHRVTATSIIPLLVGDRYDYDAADRLTGSSRGLILGGWSNTGSATDWSHLQTGSALEAFQYDAADNLTGKSGLTGSWSATVDNVNAVTSANGQLWARDANGNVLDDGTRTYAWDAENRLIGITDKASGATSQLSYDGLSRRVGVIDRSGPGATPVETRYLWCGQVPCQARDGQDRIIRRYYPQGELQGSTKLYYARDQLGSVADAVDGTGFPLSSSDYSAYGQTVKQTGTPTDRGYAGMFRHAQSGLYLTYYRAYDPRTGRWLSRDPIGEAGGINLYSCYIASSANEGAYSVRVANYRVAHHGVFRTLGRAAQRAPPDPKKPWPNRSGCIARRFSAMRTARSSLR